MDFFSSLSVICLACLCGSYPTCFFSHLFFLSLMVTTLFFFYVSVGLEKLSNDKFITYSATLENTGESTLRNQPRRMQENLDNFTIKKASFLSSCGPLNFLWSSALEPFFWNPSQSIICSWSKAFQNALPLIFYS